MKDQYFDNEFCAMHSTGAIIKLLYSYVFVKHINEFFRQICLKKIFNLDNSLIQTREYYFFEIF